MTNKVLIPATTLAVNSNSFSTSNNNSIGLICSNLSSGEVVTLQVFDAVQNTWIDYGTTDGTSLIEIYESAFSYRIVKPVTINAVGVSISQFLGV